MSLDGIVQNKAVEDPEHFALRLGRYSVQSRAILGFGERT